MMFEIVFGFPLPLSQVVEEAQVTLPAPRPFPLPLSGGRADFDVIPNPVISGRAPVAPTTALKEYLHGLCRARGARPNFKTAGPIYVEC